MKRLSNLEQSVQETRFSASGNQLCSITTSVPATTVLMSAKECNEEGSCGKLNVNTILWSPHGRLLLLAVSISVACKS